MTFNFAELQQKIDRLLFNMAEQNRRAYQLFYDPNPQDVELPQLDENGNLITVTIPNRAKIRQEIWADAQSAMAKTFYVDAVNGDNGNPGTQDSPLKTITEAINRVPMGGFAYIYVLSDYTFDETENIIYIRDKHIILIPNGKLLFKPLIRTTNLSYKGVAKFVIENGYLKIRSHYSQNFQISIIDDYPDGWDNALAHTNGQTIFTVSFGGKLEIDVYKSSNSSGVIVNIPEGFSLVSFGEYGWAYTNRAIVGHIGISIAVDTSQKIILDGWLARLSEAYATGGTFLFTTAIDIVDSSNNIVNIKDKITGIVKDSNGVPRNIISNIVL